ncbi:hypothetical protein K7957_09450 [Sphingomonas yunnanensis]|uniref:hypothetical protein n=1 Tax=Sphingomonas yunnanensis TaxID=310400 RepID=UPI001CA67290|nr:hypothetical protein [Sphingomonas yunnanensis]MBY9063158.1 hypothetical protein [Sphingomonas yunnanensis]
MTRHALVVPFAALALAACGDRVEEHADRTGNAIAGEIGEAADNVAASVDSLTDTMANQVDGVAAHSLDRAADRIDDASRRLESDVRRHADRARDRAGDALSGAGERLRDRDAPTDRHADQPVEEERH